LLGILSLSERIYSFFPGEYGAVLAGLIASSLIGAIYFTPYVALTKRLKKSYFNYKFTFLLVGVVFVSAIISILTKNQIAMMVSTSALILSMSIVSASFSFKVIVVTIQNIRKKWHNIYTHDGLISP
jgi:uncharacterized membrane protein